MNLDYGGYVNKILLPGGGRKYSGTHSKGLIWLKNAAGNYFPNHLVRKGTKSIILYCHGNGGSLGDFKSIVWHYAQWFNTSVFAIEYPSYGPAEGNSSEESVNDNARTAFKFLVSLGYPEKNIVLMGYSIGTGPSIQLASELCEAGTPPGAVVTIAAFLSICDIVRDLKGSLLVNLLAGAIDNRWDSGNRIKSVTCPSLFVHGKNDEIIPVEHSEKLFENCPSSVKRLRICPKADHTRFEEPTDTVDPIAAFLAEAFTSIDASVKQIPAQYMQCPKSVLDREAALKQREASEISNYSFTASAESSCMTVYGVFSWFIGTSTYVAQNSVTVLADSISSGGASSGSGSGSGLDSSSCSGRENGDDDSSSRAEVKEIDGGDGRTQVTLPSPPKQQRPIESSQQGTGSLLGNDPVRVSSSSNKVGGDSGRRGGSNEAMKVLRGYYESFNKHDIAGAVAFLADDVKVRFPDETKNWATAEAANDRYATMFRKSPNLKGKFSLLDIVHEGVKTTVTVYCHFTCSVSGVDTVREMVYVIQNQRICIIDNKY